MSGTFQGPPRVRVRAPNVVVGSGEAWGGERASIRRKSYKIEEFHLDTTPDTSIASSPSSSAGSTAASETHSRSRGYSAPTSASAVDMTLDADAATLAAIQQHPMYPLVQALGTAVARTAIEPITPGDTLAAVRIVEAFLAEGGISDIAQLLPGADRLLDSFMWRYTHLLRAQLIELERFALYGDAVLRGVAEGSPDTRLTTARLQGLSAAVKRRAEDSIEALQEEFGGAIKRRRGLRETVEGAMDSEALLKSWLFAHRDNPYPTQSEKDELAEASGKSIRQINNWFINARRRLLVRIAAADDGDARHAEGAAAIAMRRIKRNAASRREVDSSYSN
eukprot:c25709_g1_i1.p1 GENE.c25709_g1_i1~~c25709_g1_i1.p1  ORF type:complete len:379 (-),score=62.48 c25709_g1_i1:48-1055(-)